MGRSIYYIAQERAFAPDIADGWPQIIPAPHSPHGRLVRRYGDPEHVIAALLEVAKTVVAICDSGNVEHAKLACMETSPLVDAARAAVALVAETGNS